METSTNTTIMISASNQTTASLTLSNRTGHIGEQAVARAGQIGQQAEGRTEGNGRDNNGSTSGGNNNSGTQQGNNVLTSKEIFHCFESKSSLYHTS